MLKIRRPLGRLIFNMGIAIPGKTVFLIETAPWSRCMSTRCPCPCNTPHTLQWRHNGQDGVSNHQPHDCLLNRLFRCRTKKTPKLRVTGLCAGNSPVTGEFPGQWPATRKMFPFDEVIMNRFQKRFMRQWHFISENGYCILHRIGNSAFGK